jgi:hypothetical protein
MEAAYLALEGVQIEFVESVISGQTMTGKIGRI